MDGANKKTVSPFDFLQTINVSKTDIYLDNEKSYNAFVINRSLSYFPDTVAIANEMNRYHQIDEKLQYHFLLNIVRKRKRFSKWIKPEIENDIEMVKEYYGYNNDKARQVLPLLSAEQLKTIKNKVDKGGRK